MLTPRFELAQTDDYIMFVIHAPYANIKDTMVEVDGSDFRFYSTPYYLRLNLPGEIVENDASSGKYDCDKGDFTFKFSKAQKGEFFKNLDMITTLLAPSKIKDKLLPNIEVIANPCAVLNAETSENAAEFNDTINAGMENLSKELKNEWYTEQTPEADNIQIVLQSPSYGFGNKISGALADFEEAWIKEIIDLPLPDKTLPKDRQKLREINEVLSFDEDHYMFDLMTPEEYAVSAMSYVCEWEKLVEDDVCFSNEEKDLLKELPNKDYLLDSTEVNMILYGMVDILFASCYNCRITEGENNTESGWILTKLSSTLSWFQSFTDIRDVILCSVRRSLCFPLVRNWNFSMKVFEDVQKVIKLGKKYVLKRFCDIYSILNNSNEPRYIFNQLYIKDYLIWLQQVPSSRVQEIGFLLENVSIKKEELGLDLVEIEEACNSVKDDASVIESNLHTLSSDLEKLVIDNGNKSKYFNFPSTRVENNSSSSSSTSLCGSSSSSDRSTTNGTDNTSSFKSTNSHLMLNNSELDSDDDELD
ncbi:protein SHQ1 homolog [Copidosoma floridanum]|uniref:protein SHQ1 homolog n=1 Tax=Copidosoma floridanum TaxID=29053 RepID=UPI0006C9AF00|nr:protein SHQ1 homolog [Copidosoma floridanum]